MEVKYYVQGVKNNINGINSSEDGYLWHNFMRIILREALNHKYSYDARLVACVAAEGQCTYNT